MAEKMTLILFSGEMDKALAAFNLAIGGASMGVEVSIFFTFWGLNVIRRPHAKPRAKDWMRRMLNFFTRGGARKLPLSRFNMGGLGPWMMKKLMGEVNFPQLEELIRMAKDMGVRFIACTTSMGIMGLEKEDFLPVVDSFAGVASYLAEAREAKVNLFI